MHGQDALPPSRSGMRRARHGRGCAGPGRRALHARPARGDSGPIGGLLPRRGMPGRRRDRRHRRGIRWPCTQCGSRGMNEERVLALAGLFQALALVRRLALEGQCDTVALNASVGSVFKLDADTTAEVFGGIGGVGLGLKTLIHQIDDKGRDLAITQLAVAVLRLERRLASRKSVRDALRDGISTIARQVEHLGTTHPTVLGRLSELYAG